MSLVNVKQSSPIFYEYMNVISQKSEAWWGQNDPQQCPQAEGIWTRISTFWQKKVDKIDARALKT